MMCVSDLLRSRVDEFGADGWQIRQLKDELSDDLSDSEMSPESTLLTADMGLPTTRMSLLTSVACLPREQILAMMPPRKVVDRHVSHFFNTFDFAPGEFLYINICIH